MQKKNQLEFGKNQSAIAPWEWRKGKNSPLKSNISLINLGANKIK